MRSTRVFLPVIACIAAALSPSVARADPLADAKDLFARGRELRGHADCASAVALFRKAYELYPAGLGSLRNLAECDESLGRFASARRAWLDLDRALLTNDDRKYQDWTRDAQEAAARLLPKVSKLTIDVTAISPRGETVAGQAFDVTLNGERLSAGVVGTALERDPGSYVIRAEGANVTTPQERTVDLAAGEAKEVALRVVVAMEPPNPPIDATASVLHAADQRTSEGPKGDATRRTMAWVAMGVGAAGVIGFAASAIVRQSALDDMASCQQPTGGGGPWKCPPDLQPTVDRGTTANALANVFVVVGAVGIASGIVLFVTSQGHQPKTALVFSPQGVSAVGGF